MPGDVVAIGDYEVMISGEKYSMTEDPKPESTVVIEQINNTLASIKLEQMCDDLTLTGDLIYCAYNGIDPKFGELRALVSGLHKSFVDLLLRSEHQMGELDATAGEILPDLRKVFRFLMSGKESTAITFLNNAATKAGKLSAGMKELSDEYKALAVLAQKAVEMAETQHGLELEQIDALKQRLGEINAQNERAVDLAARLATAVKNLQAKYEEAKSKSESSENRAFALSIIGAIMKPLAEGVGAAAGAFARSQTPGLNLPLPTPAPPKEKPVVPPRTPAKPVAVTDPKKTDPKADPKADPKVTLRRRSTRRSRSRRASPRRRWPSTSATRTPRS